MTTISIPRRLAVALAAAGTIAAGTSASALAADQPFGEHVSTCAQMSLGPRTEPPAATCTHDGMTMTFPTFGAMVLHMQNASG